MNTSELQLPLFIPTMAIYALISSDYIGSPDDDWTKSNPTAFVCSICSQPITHKFCVDGGQKPVWILIDTKPSQIISDLVYRNQSIPFSVCCFDCNPFREKP